MKWWQNKPTRGEVAVTGVLQLVVAMIVFTVLTIGFFLGDRNLLRPPEHSADKAHAAG